MLPSMLPNCACWSESMLWLTIMLPSMACLSHSEFDLLILVEWAFHFWTIPAWTLGLFIICFPRLVWWCHDAFSGQACMCRCHLQVSGIQVAYHIGHASLCQAARPCWRCRRPPRPCHFRLFKNIHFRWESFPLTGSWKSSKSSLVAGFYQGYLPTTTCGCIAQFSPAGGGWGIHGSGGFKCAAWQLWK